MSNVRVLAQTDPVPNLTGQWGTLATTARQKVDELASILRSLDKIEQQLGERGLRVSTDLGPIGNAAASTRRDLEKQNDRPTFELPR
jgi:hypothetical protein